MLPQQVIGCPPPTADDLDFLTTGSRGGVRTVPLTSPDMPLTCP